jgi:putative peptidoglycan lipid II flippase
VGGYLHTRLPNPHRPVSSPFSRHRQLILGTLTVLGLSLLAKFSGAVKEIVLAKTFGSGALMDQFIFAFTVATLPASLLSSILVLSLTPLLSQIGGHRAAEKRRFLAQLWGACVALALLVAVVSWVVFPLLSPVASAGGAQLALLVGVVSFFSFLSAMVTMILVSHGKQLGSLLEGVPSLVLVTGLVAGLGAAEDALFIGLVSGIVMQLLLLMVAQQRLVGPVQLAKPVASPEWRSLSSGLGFTAAGYTLLILAMALEINIASHLPTGSVANLGYATRMTALVMGLLLTAVNRVAIVHFCNAHTPQASAWQTCRSVLLPFAAAGLLISALIAVFAPQIVAVFYERGRFDAQATHAVSQLMRWHISQLGPSLAAAVLCAYMSATGAFRTLFFACAFGFLLEVVFAYWGAAHWGLQAIAAAPMVGRAAMVVCLLAAIFRKAESAATTTTISPAFPT